MNKCRFYLKVNSFHIIWTKKNKLQKKGEIKYLQHPTNFSTESHLRAFQLQDLDHKQVLCHLIHLSLMRNKPKNKKVF